MAGNDRISAIRGHWQTDMSDMRAIYQSANELLGSPFRNLQIILIFMVIVYWLATIGYLHAGWNLTDAIYMVTLTIFSVGYGEVRPINTAYLHVLTIGTMAVGCTGMILLTGALVQVLTVSQLRQMFGKDRMQKQIDKLNGHTIICGFGRIGVMLAHELAAARSGFVIIERSAEKIAEAEAQGLLCMAGDATDEAVLHAAGIDRARVLATVLPDDAANVFITLSARNLNADLEIIARGEVPSTERKLRHAGADQVVLPTHIGAERIAEMILYPRTTGFLHGAPHIREMERGLQDFGLDLQVVTATPSGAMTGLTVSEVERRAGGAFFIIQIDHASGGRETRPDPEAVIEAGDGIVLVARRSAVVAAQLFGAPAERMQVGRNRI